MWPCRISLRAVALTALMNGDVETLPPALEGNLSSCVVGRAFRLPQDSPKPEEFTIYTPKFSLMTH